MPETQFKSVLDAFVKTPEGTSYKEQDIIGIDDNGVLRLVQVKVGTSIHLEDPYDSVFPKYKRFDAFINEFNKGSSSSFNGAFQTVSAWRFISFCIRF